MERNMRIIGGLVARVGQFPHAVALVLYLQESKSSFCGGSIIHPNFVLTVSVHLFLLISKQALSREKLWKNCVKNKFWLTA